LQIEQSKLLSTAENLGLLAILERLLVTDPGKVTALSIPFFVAAAGKHIRVLLMRHATFKACVSLKRCSL